MSRTRTVLAAAWLDVNHRQYVLMSTDVAGLLDISQLSRHAAPQATTAAETHMLTILGQQIVGWVTQMPGITPDKIWVSGVALTITMPQSYDQTYPDHVRQLDDIVLQAYANTDQPLFPDLLSDSKQTTEW